MWQVGRYGKSDSECLQKAKQEAAKKLWLFLPLEEEEEEKSC